MNKVIKSALALLTVLVLTFVIACAPGPGGSLPAPETAPSPTPSPEPAVTPAPHPQPSPVPSPQVAGNFRLLISDDVNAIDEFASLNVTITSVGVHLASEPGEWFEFPPATAVLDLVPLQGENATEIWSGNLTDGNYNKIFIYVSEVSGILKNGGNATDLKLPSGKLQLNTHFSIPEDSPVSFVFDLTVVAAGNQHSGIKYILKPVIGESGPKQKFNEVNLSTEEEEEDEDNEEEESEDTTPPVITLTGVSDEQVIVSPDTVTPVFSASDDTDPNPVLSAKLNGEPFTSGTEVSAVDEYELEITAKDASDNEAELTIQFEIVAESA